MGGWVEQHFNIQYNVYMVILTIKLGSLSYYIDTRKVYMQEF